MRRAVIPFATSLLLLVAAVPAQGGQAAPSPGAGAPPPAEPELPDEPAPTLEQRLERFHPQVGTVAIGTWAEAKLPDGWRYLAGVDGRRFLTELGNQVGPTVLGVALPDDFGEVGAFAVFSYSDDGHVNDDEAPDYGQLLQDMQASSAEQSKHRQQAGLGTVELLGWAEPPHYDMAEHKLYWAEKLRFDGASELTLNYNVRILGRTGHLVVNGVGGIEQLEQVAGHCKTLLAVTGFVDGQRYTDFDPAYDKLAAYGIGGLIAGKVALKVGLLAKLAGLLKVLWKPIAIGVAALGALVVKLFGGKQGQAEGRQPSA